MDEEQSDEDQAAKGQPEQPIPSQLEFDRATIRGNLAQMRQDLAAKKLTYHLAQAGMPGIKGHPKQHAENVATIERSIELLESFLETGEIPRPSPLAVAGIEEITALADARVDGADRQ